MKAILLEMLRFLLVKLTQCNDSANVFNFCHLHVVEGAGSTKLHNQLLSSVHSNPDQNIMC